MDVRAYLDRIGYAGRPRPDLDTLRALHRAHLFSIPFENLDIHLDRRIPLDEDAWFDKVVRRHRGGFCYELNGLFARLLEELGFRVERLSASVARTGGGFGPEFDHLVLRVDLDAPWLADVGYGNGPLGPLPLTPGEYGDGRRRFRLHEDADTWALAHTTPDGGWHTMYRFTLTPRPLTAFQEMCAWQQTSPESVFTQKRLCTKPTPEGRVTFRDGRLILTEHGDRREIPLDGPDEEKRALAAHFGVRV